MKFKIPPVNEVGLTVGLSGGGAIDSYDIRALHDAFREEFPILDRALPSPGADLAQLHGFPPLNSDPTLIRWWFKSEDDSLVLQAQDNFFGLNWRRRTSLDEAPNYPGFEKMLSDFHRHLSTLKTWNEQRNRDFPNPQSFELLYDDVIPIGGEGQPERVSDVVTTINPYRRPIANWQMAWVEPIEDTPKDNRTVLAIQMAIAGLLEAGEPAVESNKHVLRILWRGMGMRDSWEDLEIFFQKSHSYIHERFKILISDDVRKSWGEI